MIWYIPGERFYLSICGALRDLVRFAQFKKRKNTHGGVLILVNLQTEACNVTKINIPPWVFYTFFKLYKSYQIVQRITYFEVQFSSFNPLQSYV